jgi:hypothetical protein
MMTTQELVEQLIEQGRKQGLVQGLAQARWRRLAGGMTKAAGAVTTAAGRAPRPLLAGVRAEGLPAIRLAGPEIQPVRSVKSERKLRACVVQPRGRGSTRAMKDGTRASTGLLRGELRVRTLALAARPVRFEQPDDARRNRPGLPFSRVGSAHGRDVRNLNLKRLSKPPVARRPRAGASRRCSSSPYFSRAPRRA